MVLVLHMRYSTNGVGLHGSSFESKNRSCANNDQKKDTRHLSLTKLRVNQNCIGCAFTCWLWPWEVGDFSGMPLYRLWLFSNFLLVGMSGYSNIFFVERYRPGLYFKEWFFYCMNVM